MATHAVVRTDKMFGTDNRTGLWSFIFSTGSGSSKAPAAIDNGNVVVLGALVEGEREIYDAAAPTAAADLKHVVLVASPEMTYCPCNYTIDTFENAAGVPARGYSLTPGCIFSVTKDALIGAANPAVGNIVELAAGTKLKVVTSATSGSTQVGKIIEIETVGRYTFYVIQVG